MPAVIGSALEHAHFVYAPTRWAARLLIRRLAEASTIIGCFSGRLDGDVLVPRWKASLFDLLAAPP
jgi:hypothetical protein